MGVYNGKTGDEWRKEADDNYSEYKRTNDDWYLTLYRQATLKAQIADDEPDDTPSGGGNSSDLKFITGTSGADSIYNTIAGASIAAFGGNDSIISHGSNNLINGGSGNDRIYNGYKKNTSSSVTLVSSSSSNDTVEGGDGNDYIENYASSSSIVGGAGNDSIINGYDRLSTGTIVSGGSKDTVEGGSGNDSIINYASSSLIDGGDGDDIIYNSNAGLTRDGAMKSTILGGNGNDSISNIRDSVSVDGGAGNDSIYSYSYYSTIKGGDGNDTISLNSSGHDNLIQYNSGDGDDKIFGFNSSSTLQISGGTGTYSSTKSGSNIIVTVGDGKITLSGVSSAKIQGSLVNGGSSDTTSGGSSDTTSGGDSSGVSISNSQSHTLLNGTNYADEIYNWSNGYDATINGNGGDDSITNYASSSLIDGGTGEDSIYNSGVDCTIEGGAGNDSISNWGNYCTINTGAGDDSVFNYYGRVCTIDTGAGNDTISLGANAWYSFIQYKEGDGFDVVYGFDGEDTLLIGDGTGSYSTVQSGSDIIVTVGDGAITLKDVQAKTDTIYINDEPIKLKQIINLTDNGDFTENLRDNVTINGGSGDDSITNDGDNVLIDGSAGNNNIYNYGSNVSAFSGKGNDYIYSNRSYVTINGGEGNDTISNGSNAEYKVSISGGDGDDSITNKGEYVYIDGGAGNDTISDTDSWSANHASIEGGAGDDLISLASDTWGGNLITYKEGDGNDIIYNFNKNSTLKILGSDYSTKVSGDDRIITVGNGKITLADAASLSAVDMDFSKTSWTHSGTSATYGTDLETLAAVNGVKSLDGISMKGRVITVAAASLNKSNVTISDGYTLKLGKDVTKPSTTKAWSLSKTTATYKQTTSAGYKLADNAITYSAKSTETLATIKGVTSTDGIKVSGKTITPAATSLSKKITVGSGDYAFNFASDYANATIIGSKNSDTITARGKKISVDGGAGNDSIKIFGSATTLTGGAGNDSLWGSKYADKFIYADGEDVIFGFDDKDTLTLDALDFKSSYKNGVVTLKFDDGSIALKDFTATTFHINNDTYKISGKKLAATK